MTRIHRWLGELRPAVPNRRNRRLLAGFLLIGLAAGSWQVAPWRTILQPSEPSPLAATEVGADQLDVLRERQENQPPSELSVLYPRAGGLDRRIVQTGSIEALESADIYAKVSGYLRYVHVDIGSRVEAGQVLAELDVPELAQEVKRSKALWQQARGEAQQAEARLTVVQSQRETAAAVVSEAESKIQQHVAERNLRQKEADRLRKLVGQGAIESQILDEKLHRLEMAQAAEEQARRTLRVAEAQLAEAGPRVALAQAERATAHARVQVAAAAVEHAEIMFEYARIVSPFTALVTQRNVDPGDFVRSATDGSDRPLFRMLRTDQMKVVVAVPDRFVPYIKPGDRAQVQVDSLHGELFEGKVARCASFQQRQTRTMRVEIDLPNPEGRLIDGMYGSVTIIAPPPTNSLTVPTASLISGTENGRGSLYVVRGGQLVTVPVWIGQNDGVRTEVLSGLDIDDMVVSQGTEPPRLSEEVLADIRLEPPAKESLAGAADPRMAGP